MLASLILLAQACVGGLQPVPDTFPEKGSVAFGRIKVVLSGPSHRWYEPEVRFIELYNRTLDKRFRLDVESNESLFAISLPEGDYHLTRVQIMEGGFRGMAELTTSFHLDADTVNYLGTWTFSVGAPFYDRDIVLTVSSDMIQALAEAHMIYQDLSPQTIRSNLAYPAEVQTRLFQVTPYPRVRWFQRQTTS
ncbi:MAG: hypothetical protein O2999_10740 [Nitrospirae bacterium]|nr:hypothetical protein [Nitrospirota bacterium]